MPKRIAITGHTDAARLHERPNYRLWGSIRRPAKAARQILAANGLPHDRFYSIAGRADAEPLFPEDPSSPPIAASRS